MVMINVVFSISCLLFLTIIINAYFLRQRFNLLENKVYSLLLITNFIGLIIDIVGFFIFKNLNYSDYIKIIIAKFYLIYYFSWFYLLTIYVLMISFKNKYKNFKLKGCVLFYLINVIIIYALPIKINYTDNKVYSYGIFVNYVYFMFAIMLLVTLYSLLKNAGKLRKREYIPIFVLIIVGSIATVIQRINSEINLLITCHSLITTLMYFTIENPDVKMVRELIENKGIIERNSEEKSIFFFKMSEGLKEPVNNIKKEIKLYKTGKNKKDFNTIINTIDNDTNKITYLINDALGINNMLNNLNKTTDTYNIYSLLESVKIRGREYLPKDVAYNFTMPSTIPKELCGDSIRLKQVLMSIIINACNNTKQGFVNIDVASFTRYDICRLIFTIENSGSLIDIKKINEILNQNDDLTEEDINNLDKLDVDLKLSYKIIKSLGGTMYINSEENKGNTVIITLDQYIENSDMANEEKIFEYNSSIGNNKKVLLIDDNLKEINKIQKYLSYIGYNVTSVMYGEEGIAHIKRKECYDIILIDDELPKLNGINVLEKIKLLDKKSKKIVLLEKDKLTIAKHYIEDGFDNFIDKTKLIEELKQKID